jgi:hypothetical protein
MVVGMEQTDLVTGTPRPHGCNLVDCLEKFNDAWVLLFFLDYQSLNAQPRKHLVYRTAC